MTSYPAASPGRWRPASSPAGPPAARGPGSASVARSLAAAAAALRASEWRGDAALQRQSHRNTGPESHAKARGMTEYVYADEEEEKAVPDRRSFQQELAQAQTQADLRNQMWDQIQTQMRRPTQDQSHRDAREHDQQPTRPPYPSDTAEAPALRRAILTAEPAARAEAARATGASSTSSKSFSGNREATTDSKKPSKAASSPASGDSDASADVSAVVASDEDTTEGRTDASTTDKKPKKRVRYLRDTDRRNIIQRIDNGEKQAALAREFGVTRAAICHIKKNRSEILARYDLLVKSAQELDRTETFAGPPGVEMMVHEIRANSVLLLLTMLRDRRSGPSTFRRVAGRLIMYSIGLLWHVNDCHLLINCYCFVFRILLEEALAILSAHPVEVVTGTGHVYRGLELQHDFCGVAIGAEGFPFLVLFHQMEPEAPQGSIHVEMATDRRGQQIWRLDHMDVPANITEFKILLFAAACGTGDSECKAIEALCGVGVEESSISLVVILTAAEGLVTISNRFPHVKIITGAIDAKVDRHTQNITTGFGDFVTRYNGV
ncbi:hypothetical protein BBJ28_00020041 [Nothophytophthora sp. Chile5]|nr:hypothetical protein BBJ28_00020041 [Nothophytophthora sp. Chile5]